MLGTAVGGIQNALFLVGLVDGRVCVEADETGGS